MTTPADGTYLVTWDRGPGGPDAPPGLLAEGVRVGDDPDGRHVAIRIPRLVGPAALVQRFLAAFEKIQTGRRLTVTHAPGGLAYAADRQVVVRTGRAVGKSTNLSAYPVGCWTDVVLTAVGMTSDSGDMRVMEHVTFQARPLPPEPAGEAPPPAVRIRWFDRPERDGRRRHEVFADRFDLAPTQAVGPGQFVLRGTIAELTGRTEAVDAFLTGPLYDLVVDSRVLAGQTWQVRRAVVDRERGVHYHPETTTIGRVELTCIQDAAAAPVVGSHDLAREAFRVPDPHEARATFDIARMKDAQAISRFLSANGLDPRQLGMSAYRQLMNQLGLGLKTFRAYVEAEVRAARDPDDALRHATQLLVCQPVPGPTPALNLSAYGIDWKQEQRLLAEETRRVQQQQAEVQARMAEVQTRCLEQVEAQRRSVLADVATMAGCAAPAAPTLKEANERLAADPVAVWEGEGGRAACPEAVVVDDNAVRVVALEDGGPPRAVFGPGVDPAKVLAMDFADARPVSPWSVTIRAPLDGPESATVYFAHPPLDAPPDPDDPQPILVPVK